MFVQSRDTSHIKIAALTASPRSRLLTSLAAERGIVLGTRDRTGSEGRPGEAAPSDGWLLWCLSSWEVEGAGGAGRGSLGMCAVTMESSCEP